MRRYGAAGASNDYIDMNILKKIWGVIMDFFTLKKLALDKNSGSIISASMEEHINLWGQILTGKAPWNKEARCCGVIDGIAGAISDPVSEEMKVTSDNERLQESMDDLTSRATDIVAFMALCGGCVVRPVYANSQLKYELVRLGNYIPVSYDLDGTLTGAVITKEFEEKGKNYILVEKHNWDGRDHHVQLMLYDITGGGDYKQRSLESTEKTAGLTPEYTYENVDRPFLVEFRNRKTNNIDGSNIPVSIYAGRENLLEDADRQYKRLNWEQEAGEKIVFASHDLFRARQGEEGIRITPKLQKLLVKVSDAGTEEKIQEYSPALRTAEQVQAFQEILRRIEISCKLGKGTLSNLEDSRMTATQYQGGKKVLYTTVDSFESELEKKYRECAWIFAYLLSAYEKVPFDPEITVSYNDAARKDPDQMRSAALLELQNGIISKAEYRMRIFGETKEEAESKVPETAAPALGSFFG